MLEYWVSFVALAVLSFVTEGPGQKLVALSTVGFVWTTLAIVKVCSDVAGKDLRKKWHLRFMALGYGTSLVLIFFDLDFSVYTFPGVFSICAVAFSVLFTCWQGLNHKKVTPMHFLFLFNLFVLFAHTLDFPFLRLNPDFSVMGYGIAFLNIILMAVILPGITIHDLQMEQSRILEVVLTERNLQMERQSKMSSLGEMTATLVHELNNPLTLLLTRNGLLLRKVEKDQFDKKYLLAGLTQIHTTIHRMMKITKSLKTFSREVDFESLRKVKLQNLIDETLAFSSDRFLEENLPLLVGKVPDVSVNCRSVQISQVLVNLLNNAFDAIQPYSSQWVRIDFEQTLSSVRILVSDSGKGIPDEIASKIMQPFFTTKESGKGTGLGLSISQQIVKDHSGKLYVENNSLNTTFVVELPFSDVTA